MTPPPRWAAAGTPSPQSPSPGNRPTTTTAAAAPCVDLVHAGPWLYIEDDPDAFAPHRRTYAFEYDDRGRLTASHRMGADEDHSSGTSDEYDCD